MTDTVLQNFYDREYAADAYATTREASAHPFHPTLVSFLATYRLFEKKCLEVGCGRGAFQDVVKDYTGIDIARSVHTYFQKPYCCASATTLPFADATFDAVWSYAVLEHVPQPELALEEIRRVLKPGGFLLLLPAWQCRPWAAEGYPVRPYADFGLSGKLIKASIPIRNSVVYRSLQIFPARVRSLIDYRRTRKPTKFRYRRLKPNYERFWMSDSDAVNSMDPFEAYLWFTSRGDICLNYPSLRRAFLTRTGPLIIRRGPPADMEDGEARHA